MVGSAIATVGLGAYSAINSAQQAHEAKQALNSYERQQLKNVAENLTPSTIGADRLRESQAQLSANQVEALRGAGSRGIVGGLGRIEAGNQLVNQQISADLDQQQKEIDRLRAGDNANIRGLQENRELNDISALSSQYNAGQQGLMQGLGNISMGLGSLGNNMGRNQNSPTEITDGGYTVTKSPYAVDSSNVNNMSPISDRFNENNKYNPSWASWSGQKSTAPPSYMMNPYDATVPNYNPFDVGGRGMFRSNNRYVNSY
jgi:hypothetical protein